MTVQISLVCFIIVHLQNIGRVDTYAIYRVVQLSDCLRSVQHLLFCLPVRYWLLKVGILIITVQSGSHYLQAQHPATTLLDFFHSLRHCISLPATSCPAMAPHATSSGMEWHISLTHAMRPPMKCRFICVAVEVDTSYVSRDASHHSRL